MKFGRSIVCAAMTAATTVVLCACSCAPDRSQQAARLQSEIATMPGVQSFSAGTTNNITYGTTLGMTAVMPEATREQIAAVVSRITQLEGHDFDKYRKSAVFEIADRSEVDRDGDMDPGQIADDSVRLRQIASSAANHFSLMKWSRSSSHSDLEIRDVERAQDILAAANTALAGVSVRVKIQPRWESDGPWWTVQFPFTADRQTAVQQLLAALPGKPSQVTVVDGHTSRLSVALAPMAVPEADLATIIAAIGPTTQHPLLLQWGWGAADTSLDIAGAVDIGACDYTDEYGNDLSSRGATPANITLQNKLRAQYDSCRR